MDKNVKEEGCRKRDGEILRETRMRALRNDEPAVNDKAEQKKNDKGADEAEFLAEHRESAILVRFRNEAKFLRSLPDARAEQLDVAEFIALANAS